MKDIADELNRREILTANGGRWYATTVANLGRAGVRPKSGFGAVLYLLPAKPARNAVGICLGWHQTARRQKDLTARQPVAGIDHGSADDPVVIAEQEIIDAADCAVGGFDVEAVEVGGSP